MVDQIYPAELQVCKSITSATEAPFFEFDNQYLMEEFPLKFIINGTILISLMSRSLMVMSLGEMFQNFLQANINFPSIRRVGC